MIFALMLVHFFPRPANAGWGWSRIGWSWSTWWSMLVRCIETADPQSAFGVLALAVVMMQEKSGVPLLEIDAWSEGSRTDKLRDKLATLAGVDSAEVNGLLIPLGVVVSADTAACLEVGVSVEPVKAVQHGHTVVDEESEAAVAEPSGAEDDEETLQHSSTAVDKKAGSPAMKRRRLADHAVSSSPAEAAAEPLVDNAHALDGEEASVAAEAIAAEIGATEAAIEAAEVVAEIEDTEAAIQEAEAFAAAAKEAEADAELEAAEAAAAERSVELKAEAAADAAVGGEGGDKDG